MRVLVRSKAKFEHAQAAGTEVVVGDATKLEDVTKTLAGADVAVSCLGNVRKVKIMAAAYDNILNVAANQPQLPRCLLITSIGCGGTSWLVKTLLVMIVGKAGFADYEKADKRVREETTVPFVLVRPAALTDKPGSGTYKVLATQNGTFARPIARADVAKFLLDCVADRQWDGAPGVLLGGAKR